MRMEFNLPSIAHRIKEFAVVAALRSVRRNVDDELSYALLPLTEGGNPRNMSKYVRSLHNAMTEHNVGIWCALLPTLTRIRPWQENCVTTDIIRLKWNKDSHHLWELRNRFLEIIATFSRCNSLHVHCDGSL